jgi:hypothetical protein
MPKIRSFPSTNAVTPPDPHVTFASAGEQSTRSTTATSAPTYRTHNTYRAARRGATGQVTPANGNGAGEPVK